jgi:hypothetical protein
VVRLREYVFLLTIRGDNVAVSGTEFQYAHPAFGRDPCRRAVRRGLHQVRLDLGRLSEELPQRLSGEARTSLRVPALRAITVQLAAFRHPDGLKLEGRSGIEPESKAMHGFRVPAPPSAHGDVLPPSRAARNLVVIYW